MDIRKDRSHHVKQQPSALHSGLANAGRYPYEAAADDVQYRFRLMQNKIQELQNSLTKANEERDKAQKKLEHNGYVYAQQAQVYSQNLQFEKDKLDQTVHQLVDLKQRYSQTLDELKHTRNDLEDAVGDRDTYKYQLTELQREHKRINERFQSFSGKFDAIRRELENVTAERDRLKTELRSTRSGNRDESAVISGLKEDNALLREKIVVLEEKAAQHNDSSSVKITLSRESLGRHSSDESVGKKSKSRGLLSQSSIDEDSLTSSHSTSISELASLAAHETTGQSRRNLSASATNLSESLDSSRQEVTTQLRARLSRLAKEKDSLSKELSDVQKSKADYESLSKSLQEELMRIKEELSKSHLEHNATQEQIQMIIKQKGVMIEKSAESYEQSVQLQTKLLELQAEKSILEKQRDVTTRERDRVVTDAISLKKKLETIKNQRQRDAKELATMRRQRDKALQELDETSKQLKDNKTGRENLEKQHHQLALLLQVDSVQQPLQVAVEQLKNRDQEYQLLLKKLFEAESVDGVKTEDAVTKIEHLRQEKSSLLEEIGGLQLSVRKQNEDRIFDLKQAMENLYMERDGLQSRNKTLSSRVGRLEAERDKLRQECDRLDQQCQDMNATLSSPTKIEELWRESQAPLWEQAWEMKRVQVPLGKDGFAGFTVVGGRDQPQLPNVGAFIVTSVNKGGPADGVLRLGDVLETINQVDLACASHQDAVKAVKESSGPLNLILRRRKKAHAVQVGIAAAIMSLGQEQSTQRHDFSLMVQKEGLGFQYEWEMHYKVTAVAEGGPAHDILKVDDRIVQVGNSPVRKEKHSQFKKILKPHKGVLRLVIERKTESRDSCSHFTSERPPIPITEVLTPPTKSPSGSSSIHARQIGSTYSGYSYHDSTISQQSASCTQDSTSSSMPEKMVATGLQRYVMDGARPVSDGVVYGFNDQRPAGYRDDDDYSEPPSTGYSASESFLSEPSSYDCLPMTSSQTSIELTFHSVSQVSHNRLTVQSTMSTQPKEHSSQDDAYFARDDEARTTFRSRAASEGQQSTGNSQLPEPDTHKPYKLSKTRKFLSRKKRSKSGSLSQLPTIDSSDDTSSSSRDYVSSRHKSRSNSMLAMSRGRSWSNVSLSTAPSMSSVREEAAYHTMSTTSLANDPLADATYIRANYSYIPHHPKELAVEPGYVFHIFEDGPPERHRRSFWVSRLNKDGSDAGVGAIPNTVRAEEWLTEQGHALELSVYEEVEPYTDMQPVLICGVLANQITALLAESYPKLFHLYQPEILEGTARITEARLNREQSEGKILAYERVKDFGYKVISYEAINCKEAKGKHVLLAGNGSVLQTLKTCAPPISVLVKAGAEDSIRTFGPERITHDEAQVMYHDARDLEEQFGREFTSCLTLVYEDTLLKQIADIVHREKHKQVWVPINRLQHPVT